MVFIKTFINTILEKVFLREKFHSFYEASAGKQYCQNRYQIGNTKRQDNVMNIDVTVDYKVHTGSLVIG